MADLVAVRAALKQLEGFMKGLSGASELLLALEGYEREAGRRKDVIAGLELEITRLGEKKESVAAAYATRKAAVDADLIALERDGAERRASVLAETKEALARFSAERSAAAGLVAGLQSEASGLLAEIAESRRCLAALQEELSSLRKRVGLE